MPEERANLHGTEDAKSSTDGVLSTGAGRLFGRPTQTAPEQARGRPIDKRVVIRDFGCVHYACLTAQRAGRARRRSPYSFNLRSTGSRHSNA